MRLHDSTNETILQASLKNDTAILFWSATGKDSIVLLHMLAPRFKKLVCCFLYLVKGLNLVDPYFRWARSYSNVEIVELPHPDLFGLKKFGDYNYNSLNVDKITFKDLENYLVEKYSTTVVFYGSKIADSFVRRGMFAEAAKKDIHYQYGNYYPLVRWKNKDVLAYIEHNRLPKPLKLGSKTASSGIGLDDECISYLKQHYPSDFQKICKQFPLVAAKTL